MQISKFVESYKAKDFTWDGCMEAWYDWFCTDVGLVNRTKKLAGTIKKVMTILEKECCDLNAVDVSLKNCCPLSGPLYDCVRFFIGKKESCICLVVDDVRATHRFELYNYDISATPVNLMDNIKDVPEAIVSEIKKVIK